KRSGEKPFTNSGVLTIFQNSRAEVRDCTFTGNRNAVDDLGGKSVYANCIFFGNDLSGDLKSEERYELDLPAGARVAGCFTTGTIRDPHHSVFSNQNTLNAPPPKFNADFVPEAPEFEGAGYRPVSAERVR